MKVVKTWTFETGTTEFTAVTSFGPPDGSLDIDVSLSSNSHGGSYSMRCWGEGGVWWSDPSDPGISWAIVMGYAQALIEDVPHAKKYRLEWWMQAPPNSLNPNYATNAGIHILDPAGDCIAMLHHSSIYKPGIGYFGALLSTDGVYLCDLPDETEWLQCIIEWEADTGIIDHWVYNSSGGLLGSHQAIIAESIGKIPAEIRCNIKAAATPHGILYDDIILSVSDPRRRRRRAAWMNMERPAVL